MTDTFLVIEAGAKEVTKYLVPMILKPAFDVEAERQRERRHSLIINARQAGRTPFTISRFLERLKESHPEEVARVKVTKEPNKIRGYEGMVGVEEMSLDEIQLRRTD